MHLFFVDGFELARFICIQFETPGEPGVQPFIQTEKTVVQFLFITGNNKHDVFSIVTETFTQGVGTFFGETIATVLVTEGIRLVQEYDAPEGFCNHILGFNRGLP